MNGSPVALAASNPVSVGETAVTLKLVQAVAAGARVTLDYTVPTVNPIQDLAGYNAAALSGRLVGNATTGDSRAPEFLSATVSGTTAVLTYDEALDPASTPPVGAYQTAFGGHFENVRGVKVAGQTVTLTLATAAAGRDALVVYFKSTVSGVKNLVDYAGNEVAGFEGLDRKPATNVAGDTAAPALTRAAVDGTALKLSYGENHLDRASVPRADAFTVRVEGSPVALAASNPVSVGETAVTLTLAAAVAAGARVTLDYTVPTVNPIRDLAGNDAEPLSGRLVGNAATGDSRAPEFLSATVSGTTAVLTYDEVLDPASTPSVGAYQYSFDLLTHENVRGVKVAGQTVTLTLATAAAGRNAWVLYTRSTASGRQEPCGLCRERGGGICGLRFQVGEQCRWRHDGAFAHVGGGSTARR